jgi:DNA modification methylase
MQSATRSKTGGRKPGTPNRPKPAVVGAPSDQVIFVDKTREALPATTSPFPAYKLARLDQLIPYAANARTHTPAQISKIAASITEFGFTNPVLIDGKKGVVAGHGRLLAAQQLGMDVVPSIELSHLSAAQRRAYVLADNRLALDAGWDDELLRMELGDLRDDGFDLGLIGFEGPELDALFGEGNEGLTDPDAAPEVEAVAVSRLGDVWLLGGHRLVCGDCTDAAIVDALMGETRARLILTDPPYGVEFERGKFVGRSKAAKGAPFAPIANDELKGPELTAFLSEALGLALTVGNAPAVYVWSPSLAEGSAILQAVQAAGVHVQSQIIWRKTPFVIGRADYHWQHEVCWYGYAGKHHPWYGGRDKGTVWDCPKPQRMDVHPTMKPVALFQVAVENSSAPKDIVLDPFSGSGTTIIAAEMTGRICHAIEIEPKYIDVAVRRWQAFTGIAATHADTGATFDATAAERLPAAA